MPKKRGKKKQPNFIKFGEGLTWVIDNLTQDQLADMDETPWTGDEIAAGLQRLMETGWSVKGQWDYYSGSIQVTAIQREADRPNAGYAVSGRSDDLVDAYKIVLYKINVVANGDLASFAINPNNLVRG